MISRRSLFGLTFGGAVATALPASPEKPQRDTVCPLCAGETAGVGPFCARHAAEQIAPAPATAPPIRLTIGAHGHACKVEIAGVDVSHMCRAAQITAEAGDVTRLHLEMIVLEGSEIVAEPGAIDLQVRNLERRLRFEADDVRVKSDL